MKEKNMTPAPESSQAEIREFYGGESGYAPYGYYSDTGYPGSYYGYDPRVSIFPLFPIVPIPLFPPFFFPPPPFFRRRRRFYW